MPCCLSILRYRQCGHSRLNKIRCTDNECNDASICPREKQVMLVQADFRLSCEDCLAGRFSAEDEAEEEEYMMLTGESELDRKIRAIEENTTLSADMQEQLIKTLLMRQEWDDHMLSKRRIAILEEAQKVQWWVSQYAETVCELLYPRLRLGAEVTAVEDVAADGTDRKEGDTMVAQPGGHGSADNNMDNDAALEGNLTPEQATMFLSILVQKKHPDVFIRRDASGFAQRAKAENAA